MWTPEQAQARMVPFAATVADILIDQEIVKIAKDTVPGLRTLSLPQGLLVEKGPNAVVEYVKENLPILLSTVD